MHRIDEIWTEIPFFGSRKILEALRREGYAIGRERVRFTYEADGACSFSILSQT